MRLKSLTGLGKEAQDNVTSAVGLTTSLLGQLPAVLFFVSRAVVFSGGFGVSLGFEGCLHRPSSSSAIRSK